MLQPLPGNSFGVFRFIPTPRKPELLLVLDQLNRNFLHFLYSAFHLLEIFYVLGTLPGLFFRQGPGDRFPLFFSRPDVIRTVLHVLTFSTAAIWLSALAVYGHHGTVTDKTDMSQLILKLVVSLQRFSRFAFCSKFLIVNWRAFHCCL